MAKSPSEFPVLLQKGAGDDKVVRTAHSIIAYNQLVTQGYTEQTRRRPKQESEKTESKPNTK